MTRYAGTLRFPQIVQVEAFADYGCRIRGNAQQGGVAAWIPYNEIQPLPEGLLANLKKSEERRKVVDALIARNEVAIGMTIDEVGRSLGQTSESHQPRGQARNAANLGVYQIRTGPANDLCPGYGQTVVTYPGKSKKPSTRNRSGRGATIPIRFTSRFLSAR